MSGPGKSDRVNRFESKYLVPLSLLPTVRRFIAPFVRNDDNGVGELPRYVITTLQLDTPFLALHHAKEEEALDRFKLRVRTYGAIGRAPIFSEIKAKYRNVIVKHRTQIPFAYWSRDLVMKPELPSIFKNESQEIDFLRFKKAVWETGSRPMMLIRYLRESYVGTLDHYLRITFDTRLQYQPTDSWTDFGRSGKWLCMDSSVAQGQENSCVVMEVKTLDQTPMWVMDMVERLQLHQSGNCKYSTGVWRESMFRETPSMRDSDFAPCEVG